ncbi:MAG: WD40 repeat domain-containing protein [Pseudobdellovibrionaceae bacterium]
MGGLCFSILICVFMTAFSMEGLAKTPKSLWQPVDSFLMTEDESLTVDISSNGMYFATIDNHILKVRSLSSGDILFETPLEPETEGWRYNQVFFSPDSKKLAIQLKNRIEVWDLEKKTQNFSKDMHIIPLSGFRFSSDGSRIAVETDGQTFILDADSGQNIPITFVSDYFWSSSPAGNKLMGYNENKNTTQIYDFKTGALIYTFPGFAYRFSLDGKSIAGLSSRFNSMEVTVWDLTTGQVRTKWNLSEGNDNFLTGFFESAVFFEHHSWDTAGRIEFRSAKNGALLWSKATQSGESHSPEMLKDKSELITLAYHRGSTFPSKPSFTEIQSWDPATGQTNQIILDEKEVEIYSFYILSDDRLAIFVKDKELPKLLIFEK